MAENEYAIGFSAKLSAVAGDIAVGDPLVKDSDSKYLLSTAANRLALGSRRTTGIARSYGSGDNPNTANVDVQHTGTVPASVLPFVGPGVQCPVIVNSTGRVVRKTVPIAGDDVIGEADTDGNVTLLFYGAAVDFGVGDEGQVLTTVGGLAEWEDPVVTLPAGEPGDVQINENDVDLGFVSSVGKTDGQVLTRVSGEAEWADLPPGVPFQEIDLGVNVTTASTVYTRCGARSLDMVDMPDVTSIVFKATIETSLDTDDYYAEVRLFDITNNVAVDGTTMDNSALSAVDRATATEFTSDPLTIGGSDGDLRDDGETMYAVQVRTAGSVSNTATDWAILSNARLVAFSD